MYRMQHIHWQLKNRIWIEFFKVSDKIYDGYLTMAATQVSDTKNAMKHWSPMNTSPK